MERGQAFGLHELFVGEDGAGDELHLAGRNLIEPQLFEDAFDGLPQEAVRVRVDRCSRAWLAANGDERLRNARTETGTERPAGRLADAADSSYSGRLVLRPME